MKKIIDNIKSWSTQKKVFAGLASATIIIGVTYGAIKVKDITSRMPDKKKK